MSFNTSKPFRVILCFLKILMLKGRTKRKNVKQKNSEWEWKKDVKVRLVLLQTPLALMHSHRYYKHKAAKSVWWQKLLPMDQSAKFRVFGAC